MPRPRSLERPSGNSIIPSFCKSKPIKATQKAVGKGTNHCAKIRKNSTTTNKKRKTISGDTSLNKKPFNKTTAEMHEPDEITPPGTTSVAITTTSTVTSVSASSSMTTTTDATISTHVPIPTPTPITTTTTLPPNPMSIDSRQISLQISDEDKLFSRLEKRLEDKLSASLKIGFQDYDNSFRTAVDKMTSSVNELIKSNQALATQHTNIGSLEIENRKLNNKIHKLEIEQNKLKSKLDNIENRTLSNCIQLKGVNDELGEDVGTLTDKVYYELSKTIDAKSDRDRRKLANQMVLVKCKRIGKYRRDWPRPISIEFQYNQDVEYILSNH